MPPLKTFLTTAALAFALVLGFGVAPAAAATPCWKQVINDWFDGRIDGTYPIHCYQEAISHLPEDVQTYSSAKDEIRRALLAAIRHDRPELDEVDQQGDGTAALAGPAGSDPPGGALTRVLEWIGPSNAESVPLPLIVLAAIALLLLGAAGASFVARRLQARRPATAPATARPGQSSPQPRP
jgi:hypothetical protein